MQLYGTPPLVDHILDGSEGNTPAAESWAWIEDELTTAAADLPSKGKLGGQSSIGGRLTRETAYAFLGRAQLWQGDYAAASTLYNNVIATGYYALMDNYDEMNSSSWDFCDENIWEFEFNEDTSASTGQAGYWDIAIFCPAVSMWYYKYASLYVTFGMGGTGSSAYANDLIAHDGAGSERYGAQLLDILSASYMGYFSTPVSYNEGYYKVKYACLADDCVGSYLNYYSLRNEVYMRYAEVLLNYAEAVAQGGTAGSGLSGLQALNLVRNRAGLSDAPLLSMDNETYGIKAERRFELYYEGHRFIDLIRWGDAATELAECGKYYYTCTLADSDGDGVNDSWEVYTSSAGGAGFKANKNELFPIPQTELNSNTNLSQNTGW